jgi:long-chain fatty acid transport protein
MLTTQKTAMLGLLLACVLAAAAPTWAGGLYLYEIGSPDVGLAAAGYAARAQDAATAFTNPAGMTRLTRPSLMAGAQPMYLHFDFSADSNTSSVARDLPGGGSADDGDANAWMPAGGFFYVQPVNERLALGVAMVGNFGLALDYQDDWVGRYYVQEETLQAAFIQPAIAWKVNDQWSIGAGVAVLYGILDQKMAVNNVDPRDGDGKLELKDEDWTVQFNLGVLYEPAKGTRFGLTYLSAADLDFSDRAELSGIGAGLSHLLDGGGRKIDLGMTMPQAVMFSAYHEVNDRLAIMANLGWQDWSEFGKVDVSVSDSRIDDITTDMDYNDTWHVALGAQYRVTEPWLLSAGIAYDSSMLDEDAVVPSLPVGEQWRFGLGSRYAWSKDVTLGAAYELAWGGDLDMDVDRGPLAGRVSGTYESVAIHFVSLNAEWRF